MKTQTWVIPTEKQIVEMIEHHAETLGIAPSKLTLSITNDAGLCTSLRRGRSPKLDHVRKILDGLGVPHAAQ